MAIWNPWRGCKKCSDGCLHCYMHKGDFKRNINTNVIVKTKDFNKPIEKLKNGNYKMKPGIVYLCFSTDFLIKEADNWRSECWKIIKERSDCSFLFLTKRIDRFIWCIPPDWDDGYDNVVVCCTIENQKNADYRLSIFKELPIKHKCITAQPLLENINIEKYLDDIELVVVGGESDYNGRYLNYEWVLNIRNQCINKNVNFEFRQCGTNFIKDGKKYRLQTKDLIKQAKLAKINFKKQERNFSMKENIKFYKCPICGNIIDLVDGEINHITCCGKQMIEMIANSSDASIEKHVPVYNKVEDEIVVRVGETEHPMDKDHYIMWVAQVSEGKITRVKLYPEQSTETRLPYIPKSTLYAYCNKHGLWKTTIN